MDFAVPQPKGVSLRHRFRWALGALTVLATAVGLTSVSSPADTIRPTAVSNPPNATSETCSITLPGGIPAQVRKTGGAESAQVIGSTPPGGVLASYSGGDEILLPVSALSRPDLDLGAYDTAVLAQRACGLAVPQQEGATTPGNPRNQDESSDYRIVRLTVHVTGTGHTLLWVGNVDHDTWERQTATTDPNGNAGFVVPAGHYMVLALTTQPGQTSVALTMNPQVAVDGNEDVYLDTANATVPIPIPALPQPGNLVSTAVAVMRGTQPGYGVDHESTLTYLDTSGSPSSITINPFSTPSIGNLAVVPQFDFVSPAGTAPAYAYHIAEPFSSTSTPLPTTVNPATLATIDRGYGAPLAPGGLVIVNSAEPRWAAHTQEFTIAGVNASLPTGTRQTEYFSTGPDLLWTTYLEDSSFAEALLSPPQALKAGQHSTEDFNTGPLHPSVLLDTGGAGTLCGACANKGQLQFDILPLADNTPGHAAQPFDDSTGEMVLSRNGKAIATSDTVNTSTQQFAVPTGNAHYQLSLAEQRGGGQQLSTTSRTTWSFTTNPGQGPAVPGNWYCLDGTTSCSALPLVFTDYTAKANLLDQLTPGPNTLALKAWHQPNSVAPDIAGAEVSVSYDGGNTWQPLHVSGSNGDYQAAFSVPASATGQYLSLRVSAWDRAGNRIDQTVTSAYQVQ